MEKKKVCFPCYRGCEFGSLEEAVDFVQQLHGGLYVYIDKIVMYNIRFRDCLRTYGIEGVIKMLIDEAPAVAQDTKALDDLRSKWTNRMKEHIADYDIQCLPKDSRMCIDGYWFEGLKDVEAQIEITGTPEYLFRSWYKREDYKHNPSGLHVGNIWKSYPKFDSSDANDGRSYNNYVFSKTPLTEEMMEDYCSRIKAPFDSCMVHENIPADLLPILYYDGDSNCVLLATAKEKRKW